MDQKKLRESFGLFATGVIIACAKRKNFFATTFFNEKFSEKNSFVNKFEDFWQNFWNENSFSKKLQKKLFVEDFLQKIKKIFADEFFGITINSFSSVSLNPPLISFCIDNKSANLNLFKKNRYFLLNVLSEEQQALATAFATPKNSKKWGIEPYFFSKYGNPIFKNSLAFIECKKHRVIKAGDHHIIIGEVVELAKISEVNKPLIYYKGAFLNL